MKSVHKKFFEEFPSKFSHLKSTTYFYPMESTFSDTKNYEKVI